MFRSHKNTEKRARRLDVRLRAVLMSLAVVGSALGCAGLGSGGGGAPEPMQDIVIFHRAESDRAEQLEREVDRLRADLRRAEEALVKVESGLRGNHTRANAVSEIAQTQITVKKAAEQAPWRIEEVQEARVKLAEAERQVQQENAGAALFFVYRARRIAELALIEAELVGGQADTWFVSSDRVNLRAGPTTADQVVDVLTKETPVFAERSQDDWMLVRVISGRAGCMHKSLMRR
ncbi:MAG: hypothetical protein GY733_04885 [bacterium]|nr:hypothetical protein [bacterium]